ncbi:relaxase domain-containing protein [Robbsia sp. Bb-Pol-6]|uniref:Relaxase domain-containing protein n=1 Tax=Robbsia betulipollinis TaxID=2981849 RepID=A0ABT3ZN53_9BURK|nr:MobF family relaxase [Robbsia betulipollinis]MCY0387912.1 relaxase domain-containing protein [Robbsia betulipollinis]
MMTRTVINKGVLAYLGQIEYYRDATSGKEYAPTRWRGAGAEALGLKGAVDFDDFANAIEGRGPDGKALVQNAGREGRRMGWDLTFSQEKTLSILLADPTTSAALKDQIVEAHRNAVDKALAHLESLLIVRTGSKGTDRHSDVEAVFMLVDHFSSRDLDCQIHTHAVMSNMALFTDANGKQQWNSIDGATIAEYEHAIGAIYRAESAAGAQRLGLTVNMHRDLNAKGRETGKVFWRVGGIDQTTYDMSSKRTQEIEAYMLAHPGVDRQRANLATRKDKDEPTYVELQEQWAKQHTEFRQANPQAYGSCTQLLGPNVTSNLEQDEHKPRTDAQILEACTANNVFFKRADLLKNVAQEYVGRLDGDGVIAKTNEILETQSLTRYFGLDKHGQHLYSSIEMMELEAGIGRAARARKDDLTVRLTPEQVQDGLDAYHASAKFRLSDEQEEGVRWVCGDTGGIAAVTGFAGAGKTSSFMATRTTLEMAGKQMIGVSTSWKAAKKLEAETEVQSYSSASLLRWLDNGKIKLGQDSVVVFDEAGMAGSRTIAKLQKHVDKAGAKLVLMGDCLQLQPVESGAGFRLAIDEIGDTKLTEIRRQKSAQMRDTAGMFYGLNDGNVPNGAKIADRLFNDGHFQIAETESEAKKQLVKAYLDDPKPDTEKLVLAGTRSEVNDLNLAIRAGRKAHGELGKDHIVRLIVDDEFRDLTISVNDLLTFTEKNEDLGVVNGFSGVVTRLEKNQAGMGHSVTLKLQSDIPEVNGREVLVDTAECKDLNLGYAMTTHRSQGQGVESVFALFGEGGVKMLDNQLGLVSFTRSKTTYTAFGTEEVLLGEEDEHGVRHGGVKQRLGFVNLKETTLDRKEVEIRPTLSKTTTFEGAKTLNERLDDVLRRGVSRSIEQEQQSIARHAADIVRMDREAIAAAGERDAQAIVKASGFVRAMPDLVDAPKTFMRPAEKTRRLEQQRRETTAQLLAAQKRERAQRAETNRVQRMEKERAVALENARKAVVAQRKARTVEVQR